MLEVGTEFQLQRHPRFAGSAIRVAATFCRPLFWLAATTFTVFES